MTNEMRKTQRSHRGEERLTIASDNSIAEMGHTDLQHNGRVNWCWSLAVCFRPECISLGYCHIPLSLWPTESVVSRTYSFIVGEYVTV